MIELPSPYQIKKSYPLSPKNVSFIAKVRQVARDIVQGKNPRVVIITGPCSIHDPSSGFQYAEKLLSLSQTTSDQLFLVLRTFFEKPRSQGGWPGFLYDPFLNGSKDILSGIIASRQLLLRLAELQIPCATEFLDPLLSPYFEDLITWGVIGARTSASPLHRQLASSFSFPMGFKNSIDGNYELAIQGAQTASQPQRFPRLSQEGKVTLVESLGNPSTHIVLRGSERETNYRATSLRNVQTKMKDLSFSCPILVDCSHGNCHKEGLQQKKAFLSVAQQIARKKSNIIGLMIESHLFGGAQPLLSESLQYGISITDSCLDWDSTRDLVLHLHSLLS